MSYSVYDYGRMLADRPRINAYYKALERAITPESFVLDVGSGLGLFALEAARLGARRVVAIDPNPAVLNLRALARQHGLEVEVHAKSCQEVELDELADVLVFDLRGALPFYRDNLLAVEDIRSRLLARNALFLPSLDSINLCLVSCSQLYAEKVQPWGEFQSEFDLGLLSAECARSWYRDPLKPEYIASSVACWTQLDYANGITPGAKNTVELFVERDCLLHGFFAYVDVSFPNDVAYSCRSLGPVCVSGSVFFPLSAPVEVRKGDSVKIMLEAHFTGKDYVWQWQSVVSREQSVLAEFTQSTLASGLRAESLEKRAHSYQPSLSLEGSCIAFALELMDSDRTVGAIARLLFEAYPQRFSSIDLATSFVGKLALRYSK